MFRSLTACVLPEQAGRSKDAKPLVQKARRAILLTGTPATSRPKELYPLVSRNTGAEFPGSIQTAEGRRHCQPSLQLLFMHPRMRRDHHHSRNEAPQRVAEQQCFVALWQIEALLPAAKVTFTKFGDRYCANDKHYAGPKQQMWSNKYDGAASLDPALHANRLCADAMLWSCAGAA